MSERRTQFDRVERVAHIPEEDALTDGVLFIWSDERDRLVIYRCPCGCGERCQIPVAIRPSGWTLTETDSKVTLSPSVLQTGHRCKSHYFIRDSRVEWC